jgi:signal transduction histidine kinase
MRLTLRHKIFFYTAGLVLGTIAIIFFIIDRKISTDLHRFAETDLLQSQTVFREREKTRFHRLVSLTHVIAEIPDLKAVVRGGDPSTVLEAAKVYQSTAGNDLFIVTDRNGRVLARTHIPDQHGDSLTDNPHVAKALKGEVVVGTLLHRGILYQTVARPLTIGDHLLGTIVLGFQVDDPLATELHWMTGTEVTFLRGERILATSLPEDQKKELTRLLAGGNPNGQKPFADPTDLKPHQIALSGEPFLVLHFDVTEPETGSPVVLSIMKSLRPSLEVRQRIGRNLLWMGLAFLVSAMCLAFFLSRTITRSLRSLLQGTRRIAAGNLSKPIEADSQDEIGELGRSFNKMMEDLNKSRAEVEDYSRHLESKVKSAADRLKESQEIILRSEKLASIGKLASGVAHEVLNPVNIIGMHAQSWLRKSELDPKVRQSFEVIDEQVHRTARITDGLRRFSRQTPPQRDQVNINNILLETVGLLAHEFRLNDIEVIQNLDSKLPEITGDQDQLMQVLINLLTNARDAMANGGRLTLRTGLENLGGALTGRIKPHDPVHAGNGTTPNIGKRVFISLEDSGDGIPEHQVSKIFDPFFTTKPVDKGTGLGLSICHSIIEAHSGEIQVQSQVEKGTVITVRLPAEIEHG